MKKSIALKKVHYIPLELEPDILYVSEVYEVSAHLCACGCGTKTVLPLDPHEWTLKVRDGKPSLTPSIGNWELPCRSHYWITDGMIEWSYQWSEERIKAGREAEEQQREAYYEETGRQSKSSLLDRIRKWLSGFFR